MRVRLIYSPEVVEQPVLARIILNTGLAINILEAKINAQKGEMVVAIPASGDKLEQTLQMFREAGVQVQKFTEILNVDRERCISCGACISPCPTRALWLGSDWRLEYDEEKCIACKTCINACPVKAIRIRI
ncbi:MAG: 4Fe-4S binding protein [Nitrososphaerota archaeon]|nr:4Fe-4S binding protein [Candidatus Bathyarchaeota archaeon]MDW8048476.1 4Fe-4S binding protein [Nitrososphaerota archaeon]